MLLWLNMPLLLQNLYIIWSLPCILIITSIILHAFFKNIKDDALLYIYPKPRHLVYYAVSRCAFCSILFHCIANLAKCICLENPCLYEHCMSVFYGLSTWFSKANQSDCETETNFLNAALSGSLFHAKYNFPSHLFHRIVLKGKEEPKILLFK